MPCSREEQPVAVAKRLRRQLTIGWRSDRIVLPFQNQRGNGADHRLFLLGGGSSNIPELADAESALQVEQVGSTNGGREGLFGHIDIVSSDERGIFVAFNGVPHAPADSVLSEPDLIVELRE